MRVSVLILIILEFSNTLYINKARFLKELVRFIFFYTKMSGDFEYGWINQDGTVTMHNESSSSWSDNRVAVGLAGMAILVIVVLVIWLLKELFMSPKDHQYDGSHDAECKNASKGDADNFKLASEQCGYGAGKVVLQDNGKYACVCGITNTSNGEALGSTCTATVLGAGPNKESVTFSGIPFCAANNVKQCGCGGESGDALLLSGSSKSSSATPGAAVDLSWCSSGGGTVTCVMPAAADQCKTGISLLGSPSCSCGTKRVEKNVCTSKISANSKWTCGPLTPTGHTDLVIDCKCGDESLTMMHTGYNHTCKARDCAWQWQVPDSEPTEAYQDAMAAGTLTMADNCSCACTCNPSVAPGWQCTNTAACTADSDCGVDTGLKCKDGLCTEYCNTVADCPKGLTICDPEDNRCYE